MSKNSKWVPEIFYEEPDETNLSSQIPFILVPENEIMPKMLFIFESRKTDEYEPNSEGTEVPIMQLDLHQYADMNFLKTVMSESGFDEVRKCLGLKPLAEALQAGKALTDKVLNNVKC